MPSSLAPTSRSFSTKSCSSVFAFDSCSSKLVASSRPSSLHHFDVNTCQSHNTTAILNSPKTNSNAASVTHISYLGFQSTTEVGQIQCTIVHRLHNNSFLLMYNNNMYNNFRKQFLWPFTPAPGYLVVPLRNMFFTGQMPFRTATQQCQCNEGI